MATVHWNEAALRRALRTPEMADAVEKLGDALADKVRAQGIRVEGEPGDVELPVEVNLLDDGELTGSVVLAHPAGLSVQAKHGALSRAASELGLEVNG